jgi:hypothetical protein
MIFVIALELCETYYPSLGYCSSSPRHQEEEKKTTSLTRKFPPIFFSPTKHVTRFCFYFSGASSLLRLKLVLVSLLYVPLGV